MRRLLRAYLVGCGVLAHVLVVAAVVALVLLGPGTAKQRLDDVLRDFYTTGVAAQKKLATALNSADTVALEPAYDAFLPRPAAPSAALAAAGGRTLTVGPNGEYKLPSAAARAAQDGDTVVLEGGNYAGDSAVWKASGLHIVARNGTARLDATGHRLVQEKAIWIIQGDDVVVENIEFTGARSRDSNGAGIRAEGQRLVVRGCYFHDNEAGILAGEIKDAHYTVEHSEFARNGHSSGQSHQIYVGRIRLLEIRYSYLHDTIIGSSIKSRAQQTVVAYNRIVDGRDGRSNYAVDLSSGGQATVVGNIIQQNRNTENYTIISYAPEGQNWDPQGTLIAHNTVVNDRDGGRFIKNHDDFPIYVYNNLFVGSGVPLEGPARMVGNVWMTGRRGGESTIGPMGGSDESGDNRTVGDIQIVDRGRLDYRLQIGAAAIDAAAPLPVDVPVDVQYEYRHPFDFSARITDGEGPDSGAFEYINQKQ